MKEVRQAMQMVFLAAVGLLVVGFGIKTYTPLGPTTPVIRDYNVVKDSSAIWHFATVRCIAEGASLKGYVTTASDFNADPPNIELDIGAELMTLARAKRLIHDRPSSHDLDPLCLARGYFEMRESRAIWSVLGMD